MKLIAKFDVLGQPAPQGSKKHVGRGVMIETSKHLPSWRDSVADAARTAAAGNDPLTGPLELDVTFRFAMPASRSAKIRALGQAFKTSAPDLDKLVRAVGDSLKTGGLIRDDALIVRLDATKLEVDGWTGAIIELREACLA
jgi:crossover junction endodeoxyribonuclease RusA